MLPHDSKDPPHVIRVDTVKDREIPRLDLVADRRGPCIGKGNIAGEVVSALAMPKEMEGPTVADEVPMPRTESCEGTPPRACELNYGLCAFS